MTDSPTIEKFQRQELQYRFPYHYIPHFDEEGYATKFRILSWGLEYLCYQLHIAKLIEKCHPTSILDVGCGDGRFLGLSSDVIPRRVGVDLSDKAISHSGSIQDSARNAMPLNGSSDGVRHSRRLIADMNAI